VTARRPTQIRIHSVHYVEEFGSSFDGDLAPGGHWRGTSLNRSPPSVPASTSITLLCIPRCQTPYSPPWELMPYFMSTKKNQGPLSVGFLWGFAMKKDVM